MKKEWLVKSLSLGIVILFIRITVTPTLGISNYLDDTTPPVTTISFDPPEPDGLNGWYISDVTITLNATDDDSGINITYYIIDHGMWHIYTEPFITSIDGVRLIEYFSIDNAGNPEEVKSAVINIDQTEPEIQLTYDVMGGDPEHGWTIIFTATATDDTSSMERVEFYINHELQETVNGSGPTYQWEYHLFPFTGLNVIGLILNPEIKDDYVKFFAIIVIVLEYTPYLSGVCAYAYDKAGNVGEDCISQPCPVVSISPGIYLFKNLTLPSDYEGYIGRFLINAEFYL